MKRFVRVSAGRPGDWLARTWAFGPSRILGPDSKLIKWAFFCGPRFKAPPEKRSPNSGPPQPLVGPPFCRPHCWASHKLVPNGHTVRIVSLWGPHVVQTCRQRLASLSGTVFYESSGGFSFVYVSPSAPHKAAGSAPTRHQVAVDFPCRQRQTSRANAPIPRLVLYFSVSRSRCSTRLSPEPGFASWGWNGGGTAQQHLRPHR